eukprot:3573887-Rhodomonas_salina.1
MSPVIRNTLVRLWLTSTVSSFAFCLGTAALRSLEDWHTNTNTSNTNRVDRSPPASSWTTTT